MSKSNRFLVILAILGVMNFKVLVSATENKVEAASKEENSIRSVENEDQEKFEPCLSWKKEQELAAEKYDMLKKFAKKEENRKKEQKLKEMEDKNVKRVLENSEIADMKRKEKINLMLKSFDAHILNKELEKQKQRDINKHIREKEQQRYNAYMTEIKEQRRHKEEVLRKYREDLRKQIEANKQRAIDDYKRSFGIIPEASRTINDVNVDEPLIS